MTHPKEFHNQSYKKNKELNKNIKIWTQLMNKFKQMKSKKQKKTQRYMNKKWCRHRQLNSKNHFSLNLLKWTKKMIKNMIDNKSIYGGKPKIWKKS